MATINNKVVIITGASSGIGLALSREMARNGAKVVMAARSIDKLKELEQELTERGFDVLAVKCDVTNREECKMLIDQTINHYKKIDICVCNAGISMRALLDDLDLDILHKLMDVNFWGAVNCIKYALPHIQQSRGSIVGVSSVAGIHGLPARSGYSASKYALNGFLETIRIENIKKGVHVMIAYPGFTSSNIRQTALTADGTQQKESPLNESKIMSAEKVSQIIIRGINGRKRNLLMDFQGRASYFIKKFAPKILDKLFYSYMEKESNSPLKQIK